MELNRDAAKGAIVSRTTDDPELDATLGSAHQYQLGLEKEKNRHAEKMRSWFSRVFGNDDNVGAYVAAGCAVIGLCIAAFCIWQAHNEAGASEFWSKQSERVFSFVATRARLRLLAAVERRKC
jgi:hypothetical protein